MYADIHNQQPSLLIHPQDDVAVALQDLPKGESLSVKGRPIRMKELIPVKHKFATREIALGEQVKMYGLVVGRATQHIAVGELITQANLQHATQEVSLDEHHFHWQGPDVSKWADSHFMGIPRAGGKVGIANYWLVIPMVFCENRNIQVLRKALMQELGYEKPDQYVSGVRSLMKAYEEGKRGSELGEVEIETGSSSRGKSRFFPHVDGIRFLTHDGGCGGTREDAQVLIKLLAAYVAHPNVAGATVLSLGCQHAQMHMLEEIIQDLHPDLDKPIYYLEQQKSINEPAFIGEAIQQTFIGLSLANEAVKQPFPLSELVIGLECGGSDGFSGISANPAVGKVSDLLVALGGSSILSEFPELSGVEQDIINRSTAKRVSEKFLQLMRSYERAAKAVGSGFEANPSPGNIKDGLITDAMKSAGAARKGGTSPVVDVLDYTEILQNKGLNLLCTPGNDVESTTGLAAAGAHIILFTTGLGTPTGNPVAPTLKIATNTALTSRMGDIIDYNAGQIIDGEKGLDEVGREMLDLVIAVANGQYVPHAVRLGQHDFIPWKRGVSL